MELRSPPFGRGQYQPLNGASPVGTQALAGDLGRDWDFNDWLYNEGGNGPPPVRSGAMVKCRLVRNETGSAILPKQACQFDPTDVGKIIALADAQTEYYALADEFLPAAGVPDDGIFWVVVEGNAKCIMDDTIAANITAGDYLCPGATAGTLDIPAYATVDDGTKAKTFLQTARNARAKATAAITAASDGGTTQTVQMTP